VGWLDPIFSLFVVANVLPILPVVLGVASAIPRRRRRRTLLSALLVGNLAALAFALLGGAVLGALGSGLDVLRVAGGLILLVFAIYDLLFSREQRKEPLGEIATPDSPEDGEPGLVPLGIPMMVGPATLAAVLVLGESHGPVAVTVALAVNGAVNALVLSVAGRLMDLVGHGVMRSSGKVFGLLLAALAVSMIRTGITNMWSGA
jgi:multiple antibiotic resistance protein